jgi:hypothetical protein
VLRWQQPLLMTAPVIPVPLLLVLLLPPLVVPSVVEAAATGAHGGGYTAETARALQEVNVATLCPAPSLRNWTCSRCVNSSVTFRPEDTHVIEAGTRDSLLAVVAPDHKRKWIVVALRGTVDSIVLDWIIDLEWNLVPAPLPGWPNATRVHSGFLEGWQQLQPGIMAALGQLQGNWAGYKLFLTGHSLGASMASLMAASLLSANYASHFNVITFGEPRTGNAAFAAEYSRALNSAGLGTNQHFRCVHADDIIPHYPLRVMPTAAPGSVTLDVYHHTARCAYGRPSR